MHLRSHILLFASLLISLLARVVPAPALAATSTLTLVFRGAAGVDPVACRLSILGPDGWLFDAPDETLRSHFAAGIGSFIHVEDQLHLTLEHGSYEIHAVRGLTGVPIVTPIELDDDATLVLPLDSWVEPAQWGWYAGDTHTHSVHQNDPETPDPYAAPTPDQLALAAMAEGLDVMFVLDNLDSHPSGPIPGSPSGTVLAYGEEFRSGFWGHVVILGLGTLIRVDGQTSANAPWEPGWPTLTNVLDTHEPPLVVLAHPHTTDEPEITSFWPGTGHAREMPALAVGQRIHAMAVASGSNMPDRWALADYLYALIAGAHWAAIGETDAVHSHYFTKPVGMPRTYVHLDGPPPPDPNALREAWKDGLAAGRSFATSGPVVLEFTVEGQEMGAIVQLSQPGNIQVHMRAQSLAPITRATLHGAESVHWQGEWPAGRFEIDEMPTIAISRDDFVVLEIEATEGSCCSNDATPRAVGSPVWIELSASSPPSAAFARLGADGLAAEFARSISRRGYATAADSIMAADDILGAAGVYEAMVDDLPGPFDLVWPEPGRVLGSTGGEFQWRRARTFDGEPVSYRLALDEAGDFVAPTWYGPTPDSSLVVSDLLPGAQYHWRVEATEPGEAPVLNELPDGTFTVSPMAVAAPSATADAWIQLGRARSIRGQVRIALRVPRDIRVGFAWYDARGRRIREHPFSTLGAGRHELVWDGKDRSGRRVAAGVYWLRAMSEGRQSVRSAVLLAR